MRRGLRGLRVRAPAPIVGGFEPPTGLLLWVRPQLAGGVYVAPDTNDAVRDWSATRTGEENALRAIGDGTVEIGSIGGVDAIDIAAADWLQIPEAEQPSPTHYSHASGLTVACVARLDSFTGFSGLLGCGRNSSWDEGWGLVTRDGGTSLSWCVGNWADGADWVRDSAAHVFVADFDAGTGVLRLYVDGVLVDSATRAYSAGEEGRVFELGSWGTVGTDDVCVGEVLVWGRKLSDSERASTTSYLAALYGL